MTFTELQQAVSDFLEADSKRLSATNSKLIINLAQREICETAEWPFVETVHQGFAFTVGIRNYDFPTTPLEFSRPFFIIYENPDDTTTWVTMEQISYDKLIDTYGYATNDSSADPTQYAVYGEVGNGGQLYVGATPKRTINNVSFNYYGILTDLANPGDTNDLTVKHPSLLLYKSLALASSFLLEDERAQFYEGAYNRELSRSLSLMVRRRHAGQPPQQPREPR